MGACEQRGAGEDVLENGDAGDAGDAEPGSLESTTPTAQGAGEVAERGGRSRPLGKTFPVLE